MLKYLQEILISCVVAIIFCAITIFFSGNVIAGISVFTAVLVTFNFVLSRYETRTEAPVELKVIERDNTHFFLVSITNTGGKTIYLDKGGVKTKDGIIVDFDEEVSVRLPEKPEPKKSKYGFLSIMDDLHLNLKPLPMIKSHWANIVQPGDAQNTRKEVWKVLSLLIDKKTPPGEKLELKGFFTDQLNHEYESEWMQFNRVSLVEIAKADIKNKTG